MPSPRNNRGWGSRVSGLSLSPFSILPSFSISFRRRFENVSGEKCAIKIDQLWSQLGEARWEKERKEKKRKKKRRRVVEDFLTLDGRWGGRLTPVIQRPPLCAGARWINTFRLERDGIISLWSSKEEQRIDASIVFKNFSKGRAKFFVERRKKRK